MAADLFFVVARARVLFRDLDGGGETAATVVHGTQAEAEQIVAKLADINPGLAFEVENDRGDVVYRTIVKGG